MAVLQKEIARKLGVTEATVSMALSDNPRIGLATRRRVNRLAKNLGYKPNIFSIGLQGKRTKTIGLLWSLEGPHSAVAIVREFTLRAMHHGYVTYVNDSLSDPVIIRNALDDYERRGVDGVIFQLPSPEVIDRNLRERLRKFPAVVSVGGTREDLPGDHVIINYASAIRSVVNHFVDTGRRNPVYIVGGAASTHKTNPFLDQLRKRGLKPSPERLLYVGDVPLHSLADGYYEKLERVAASGKPFFDAVFCENDEGAVAVCGWLRKRGMNVPKDVAVVGFNDTSFARFLTPPLASVCRSDTKVAEAVERLLFSRCEKAELEPRYEEIPMEFIHRESAG